MKKTAMQLANYVLYKSGATPGEADADLTNKFRMQYPTLRPAGYTGNRNVDPSRMQQSNANRPTPAGYDAMGGLQRSATGTLTQAARATMNPKITEQGAATAAGPKEVQFVGEAASQMKAKPHRKSEGRTPPAQTTPGAGTLVKGTAQGASSKSPGALGGIGTLAAGFTDPQNQQSVAFAPSKARTPAASPGAGALATGMTDATAFLRGVPGGGFNDPQSQQSVAFAPSKQRGNQAPAKPTSTLAQAKGKPRMGNMDFTTAGNFPDNFNPEDQNNYLASNNAPTRQRSIINPYDTRGQGALAQRSGR